MKNKILFSSIIVVVAILGTLSYFMLQSCAQRDKNIKKLPDGSLVVNTTTLGKDIIGYESTIPVEITVKDGIVVSVVALENMETPRFFEKVEKNMIHAWDGLPIEEAAILKVDGVTGCTLSSDALRENVRIGLKYLMK